jgi:mannose-6-phosphate isomerase-like protein (cupin superfamily)
VFTVIEGEMGIQFRDGKVDLNAGELFVVPKGVEHKPFAEKECHVLLIEPAGTINTGSAGGERTAADNVWI